MKLKLNDLKVNSFETTLQEDTQKTIRGGSGFFGCNTYTFQVPVFLICRFCPTGGGCNTELCNDGI